MVTPMVKCKDCGYLTFRHAVSRDFIEVDEFTRKTGKLPPYDNPATPDYEPVPICFARAYSLKGEILQMEYERLRGTGTSSPEHITPAIGEALNPSAFSVFTVIDTDKPCQSFVKWQQGFTPKEHREMVDRETLLKWQVQREESDRDWRAEQAKLEREWRTQEARHRRYGTWILFAALLASILIPIVAAFIERGPEPSTVIVQPSESAPPVVNVQPPEVRLEPNIIIDIPTPLVPDTPSAQPEVGP